MPLASGTISEAAQLLLATRAAGQLIERLPSHLTPTTVEDGYAIQHAAHDLASQPLGPWKIGATTEQAQRILGLDGPFIGRPDPRRVIPSGAELALVDWFVGPPLIETEIGLVARVDLAELPDDPMDLAEVIDVVACLELVNPRFSDMTTVGAPSLIADNAVASAIVASDALGWSVDQVRQLDRVPVSIEIDGVEKAVGTGAMALGHPLNVLGYAATLAAEWGTPIKAGELVITGTCTGAIPGAAGMRCVGHVGDATVEIDFR